MKSVKCLFNIAKNDLFAGVVLYFVSNQSCK